MMLRPAEGRSTAAFGGDRNLAGAQPDPAGARRQRRKRGRRPLRPTRRPAGVREPHASGSFAAVAVRPGGRPVHPGRQPLRPGGGRGAGALDPPSLPRPAGETAEWARRFVRGRGATRLPPCSRHDGGDPRRQRLRAAAARRAAGAGRDAGPAPGHLPRLRRADDGGGALASASLRASSPATSTAQATSKALAGRRGRMSAGGATHAWTRVYLPGAGWVEFDPTNGIVGNRDLIRVAIARDPRMRCRCPAPGPAFPADLGMTVDVDVSSEAKPAAATRPRAGVPRSTAKGEPAIMQIRAGYEIAYDCPQPTPMLLALSVHPAAPAGRDRAAPHRLRPAGRRHRLPRLLRQLVHPHPGAGRAGSTMSRRVPDAGSGHGRTRWRRGAMQHAVRGPAGRRAGLPARQPLLRDRPADRPRLVAVRRHPAGLGAGAGDLRLRARHITFGYEHARPDQAPPARPTTRAPGRLPRLRPPGGHALPLHEHPGALLHRLSRRHRRAARPRRWISAPGSRPISAATGTPSTPATTPRASAAS